MEDNKYKRSDKILNKSTILSSDDVDFNNLEIVKENVGFNNFDIEYLEDKNDDNDENIRYILRYKEDNKKYICFEFNLKHFEIVESDDEKFKSRGFKFNYIKIKHNDENKLLFDFFENFDKKVQEIVNEDNDKYNVDKKYKYKSCIEDYCENKYIILPAHSFESKKYNNSIIYCRPYFLSKVPTYSNYKGEPFWNIRLEVLKIIENK